MAKFEKGKSGNPKGRPKGSKDKTTGEVKRIITEILADNLDRANRELSGLKGKAFIDAFAKLAGIVMPRTIANEDDAPFKMVIEHRGMPNELKSVE